MLRIIFADIAHLIRMSWPCDSCTVRVCAVPVRLGIRHCRIVKIVVYSIEASCPVVYVLCCRAIPLSLAVIVRAVNSSVGIGIPSIVIVRILVIIVAVGTACFSGVALWSLVPACCGIKAVGIAFCVVVEAIRAVGIGFIIELACVPLAIPYLPIAVLVPAVSC